MSGSDESGRSVSGLPSHSEAMLVRTVHPNRERSGRVAASGHPRKWACHYRDRPAGWRYLQPKTNGLWCAARQWTSASGVRVGGKWAFRFRSPFAQRGHAGENCAPQS